MDDRKILELYRQRSEAAISETAAKFGAYCHSIAYRILGSREDSEECVNDTYLRAWNSIPPHDPENLAAYLGKITRNLALDRYEALHAGKRGGGQLPLALEELSGCLPGGNSVEDMADELALAEVLNRFLDGLTPSVRRIFLLRYWYMLSVEEIGNKLSVSQSKVKMSLLRARNKLKKTLESEEIGL